MFIIIVSSHVFKIARTKVYNGLHPFTPRANRLDCSIGLDIKQEVFKGLGI